MSIALPEAPLTTTVAPTRGEGSDTWTITGQPLRDVDLRKRINDAVRRARELLRLPEQERDRDFRDFATARDALDVAHELLSGVVRPGSTQRRPASLPALVDLLFEVQHLRVELSQGRAAQQAQRFAAVRAALARLRSIRTVAQMIERAPAELCRCGFDRAFSSRVQDSVWYAEACYIEGDPEWAKQIVEAGRAHAQPLDHADLVLEAEMVRRRAPLLVSDVQSDGRVHGPIRTASQSRSYVAAPIMPDDRVIGFLHADCYMGSRHVDEDDRAVLWMFAEGFGYALQRTILFERLFGLRNQFQGITRSMGTVMDDVCAAETVLPCHHPEETAADTSARPAAMAFVAPESRLESLLTRREIDVLRLMAMGKSNGQIAESLVIRSGTVKSHVARILGKMRAANRAEAVFRFTRLAGSAAGAGAVPAVHAA